eukprot:5878203-Pleurochrysis_carterae.AAC.2
MAGVGDWSARTRRSGRFHRGLCMRWTGGASGRGDRGRLRAADLRPWRVAAVAGGGSGRRASGP